MNKRIHTIILIYRMFTIDQYDELCEEHFKMDKIVTLDYSRCKIFLYICLNICTGFLINLFMEWWTVLKLKLLYKKVPIERAKFVGIYGKDGIFVVVNLKKDEIPKISNENVIIRPLAFARSAFSFKYKLFNYVYNPQTRLFTSIKYDIKLTNENIHNIMTRGLNPKEYRYMKNLYGESDLNIEVKSFFRLLFIEFSDPFYLFQVFSVILWYCNDYQVYATVIVFFTVVSLFTSSYSTLTNLKSIQRLARYSVDVDVYRRNEQLEEITDVNKIISSELVPGDIFTIPEDGSALPCDCVLLTGSVIVNEAMLTGESTPIIKAHLPNVPQQFDRENDKKYFLFAGTKIMQKRSTGNSPVLGLVFNTGFNTVKGNLIRSILYPKEVDMKFQRDSVKYIYFMGFLAIIGFGISLPFLLRNQSFKETFIKSLDLITTTVPPSLPACLSIGISAALSRLSKYGILCIARERVNVAGKINMCVFDKTGTLTEDFLDIAGYLPVKAQLKKNEEIIIEGNTHSNTILFDQYETDAAAMSSSTFEYYKAKISSHKKDRKKELKQLFVECLATCHGITRVNGKLIGDPIDVRMFEAVGWILNENVENQENYDALISSLVRPKEEEELSAKLENLKKKKQEKGINEDDDDGEEEDKIMDSHYELGIVRRFDFSSKLQRMSVLVKNIKENCFKIFVKGSPEKIRELCKKESIPENFNEQLARYTSKGLRVLALAGKSIKMTFVQAQEVSRPVVESNLIFLGLLIVQNKLKPATAPSIEVLDNAHLRMVMATGDNILTAISVSKECKLVPPTATVYSCEFSQDETHTLKWNTVENFKDETENENEGASENNDLTLLEMSMAGDLSCLVPDSLSDDYRATINGVNEEEQVKKVRRKKKKGGDDLIDSDKLNIDISEIPFKDDDEGIIIALTGTTFETLLRLNKKYLNGGMDNEKYKQFHQTFRMILKYCRIYARMAPEHKTMLVESLRKEEFTVLMCGDGANDCGALRAADVGVSLSTEEASIAAHFTSKVPDISCLIKLLREGKSALVTSIQTFKYMMIYSLIQFTAVTLLTIFNSYLSDWQFLSSDLIIIFPLAYFISKTGAYDKLTHHQPTGDLISFPIIFSILLQTVILFCFQFGSKLFTEHFYKFYRFGENAECNAEPLYPCYDNTVIFLISNAQYLLTAIAFSMSRPFRKSIYTNPLLTFFIMITFAYSIYFLFYIDPFSSGRLKLIEFDGDEFFKYYIISAIVLNLIVAYFTEKVIVPFFKKVWNSLKMRKMQNKISQAEREYNLNMIVSVKNYIKSQKKKKESEH